MGKYLKNAKTTVRDVAVMDLPLGVRTRAKTLALRQQQQQQSLNFLSPHQATSAAGGYLQLRSRRLLKPPISGHYSKRQKHNNIKGNVNNCYEETSLEPNPNMLPHPKLIANSRVRVGCEESGSGQERVEKEKNGSQANNQSSSSNESKDLGIEGSFAENVLDFEARERSTRESTPCSLIRDPEAIKTPCSTAGQASVTESNRRTENSIYRHIPTEHEMQEFFLGPEKDLQRQFINKYNFDPVNDMPLPGRYEWKKLDP